MARYDPVAARRLARRRRRARLVAAAVGALVAVLVFLQVLETASENPTELRLADEVFKVNEVAGLVDQAPVLFPDLLSRGRAIYVQHLGGERWTAFVAHAGNCARTLTWDAPRRRFRDPCTGETFPADGAGLTHFETTVDRDGDLVIDLREEVR